MPGSSRSIRARSRARGARNPATYTGLLDPIRTAFAKANGVKPALFSANSEGACQACNGAGVIYTDLGDDGRRRDRLRGVRGQALPGRRARVHAGRQEHRRRARDVGRRGAGLLRHRRGGRQEGARDPRAHVGRRPRLHLARSAAHHPVGRRAPAAQARHPHGRQGRHLRARRADVRPAPRRRREPARACSTGWSTPARPSSSSSTTRP